MEQIVTYFNFAYPKWNEAISCQPIQNSRAGDVREILNAKTVLLEPTKRVTLREGRSTNVFFLLAEALWIFNGKRDVELLTIFNTKMKEYSDDGVTFHAPYGWRLRHWGVPSDVDVDMSLDYTEGNVYGVDQLSMVVKEIANNPESRRIVASIWNPLFDLGTDSKDLPCNDMLMWKVRNGHLHLTVQNRSNDLHLGLFTNVFQFSVINELIALCCGLEVGTQTHNSQSLHVYESFKEKELSGDPILYDGNMTDFPIDFSFNYADPERRYYELQVFINDMLSCVKTVYYSYLSNEELNTIHEYIDSNFTRLMPKSAWFAGVFKLLCSYVTYKFGRYSDKMESLRTLLGNIGATEISTGLKTWDMIRGARLFVKQRVAKLSV